MISATSLTNSITSSYSTSVTSENYQIMQNPKMAKIFVPGIIGSTSPPWAIFSAITFDPASPNPNASSAPILTIVYSRMTVSKTSFFAIFFFQPLYFFLSFIFSFSYFRASFSSSYAASNGSLAILFTFWIILMIGKMTNYFASLVKKIDPTKKTIKTNIVLRILKTQLSLVKYLKSKTATMLALSSP